MDFCEQYTRKENDLDEKMVKNCKIDWNLQRKKIEGFCVLQV